MKSKLKILSVTILMIAMLICFGHELSGQMKVSISAGAGFPEFINAGVGVSITSHLEIRLSVGCFPDFEFGNWWAISGDVYYHFGSSSRFTNMHPWYGRLGFSWVLDPEYIAGYNKNADDFAPYLRFGRDFNFTERIGLRIDGGVAIVDMLYPAGSLSFFCRL